MDESTPKRPGVKHSFVFMALLVLVLLFLAVYANVWKDDRRVTKTIVEGNQILAAKDILTLAKIPSNSLLFDLDLFAIEQRVMKNPFVKSAAAHRDIPNRVCITVTERVPVAVMAADKLFYVDAEGFVLPPISSQVVLDLPVLTDMLPADDFNPGKQTENKDVLNALSLLLLAKEIDDELYRNISELSVNAEGEFHFFTSEFGVPVLLGRDRFGQKLVKFESFWKSVVAREGAARLRYVDVRFDGQIVVRWNQNPA